MYKNILVPMALSRTQATRTAVNVAERLKADGGKITAIHVLERVPSTAAAVLPANFAQARRSDALAGLKEQLEGHDDIAHDLVEGHPGRAIVDYAEQHGCDLIVTASHRPDVTDIFLGSTAAWVVRHANCSVHVTR